MNRSTFSIFRRGSKTYFYSSLFFPPAIRDDVFTLYSFVRVADDFVDATPQQADAFHAFRASYEKSLAGTPCDNDVINGFIALSRRRNFPPAWADSFLNAMQQDLHKQHYTTWTETLAYVYGSAEVIGLFMATLMGLPPEAHPAAQMQGRAMQVINFIRDIDEDNQLGRTYLPLEDSGLDSLERDEAFRKPECFTSFILRQLERYRTWQREAEKGYRYIPTRYLIPIKTAANLYNWTARRIEQNPFALYEKKLKPGIPRIAGTLLRNTVTLR